MRTIVFFVLMTISSLAIASTDVEIEIHIKDHKFQPDEIKANEGQKIKIIIINDDETIEEFESEDLKREKIVPPKGQVNVILAPLKPGKYFFYGDFHKESAQGHLIIE